MSKSSFGVCNNLDLAVLVLVIPNSVSPFISTEFSAIFTMVFRVGYSIDSKYFVYIVCLTAQQDSVSKYEILKFIKLFTLNISYKCYVKQVSGY